MELLNQHQCFQLSGQDVCFTHVKVLFRQDNKLFYAFSSKREAFDPSAATELHGVRHIPTEAYRPISPAHLTVLEASSDDGIYVKMPNLINFEEGYDLGQAILREVEVCEILRESPHPNIGLYLGCRESEGRIDGICFKSYPETLMSKLNPRHLCKKEFLRSRSIDSQIAEQYLAGIEAGIRHLHALGYVHNDINPMNVMIDNSGSPVLIDFDSALKGGYPLEGIKRTHGWYDRSVKEVGEENDWTALEEIRVWLLGDSPDQFQFEG